MDSHTEGGPVFAADLATFRQWFERKLDATSPDTPPGTERSEVDKNTGEQGDGG